MLQWLFRVIPSFPSFLASISSTISVPNGFTKLYYLCFLLGLFIAGFVYALLHYVFPAPLLQAFVGSSSSPRDLMAKYEEEWDSRDTSIIFGQVDHNQVP